MNKKDTYFYIGKLVPEDDCLNFNPGEMPLGNGWVLDVFNSTISLWNPEVDGKSYDVRSYSKEALDILVAAFNFVAKTKLRPLITNLIEAKGVRSENNLIWGFYPQSRLRTPSRRNPLNRIWRSVAKAYPKINGNFWHKVALKDFQSAIENPGDDAFFYTYRILEDVRHSVTSSLEEGLHKNNYWMEMHKTLGTSSSQVKSLCDAATAIRHGDLNDLNLVNARRDRERILESGFQVMRIEFKRHYKALIRN